MTDIEKKAREYAKSDDGIGKYDYLGNEYEAYVDGVVDGAKFALGNQWRDAEKEKPDDKQAVLILTTYIGAKSGEPRTLVEQFTYFEQYGFWLKEKSEQHLKLKVHAWMEIPDYKPKGE